MTTLDAAERNFAPVRGDKWAVAVSWPAIFAGATAATVLSLILLILGAGLGLSTMSPWADHGVPAVAITWSTILWVTFMAFVSSGLGGYIAGRLRSQWPSVDPDEVYFRDTAHGFLAWALATLVSAALLTSATGTVLKGGAAAGAAAVATGGAGAAASFTSSAANIHVPGQDVIPEYTLDSLFRLPPVPSATRGTTAQNGSTHSNGDGDAAASKTETGRILANSLHSGPLSADDTRYAAELISQRTGLSREEAEARVTTAYSTLQKNMQESEVATKRLADEVRKNAAYASLWIFVSLLVGAFVASLTATFGGRRRDL